MKRVVEDTCEVLCEDNGRKIVGDLLSFREHQHLTVSLQKSVKLEMHWNGQIYEGKSSGLTFTSDGPIIKTFTTGRR